MSKNIRGKSPTGESNIQQKFKLSQHEALIQYKEALDLWSLHYSKHSGIQLSSVELAELNQMIHELELEHPSVVKQQGII
ncbi:MAG: hypothetical protein KC646_08135 [Candidatus Cloacimonetes bacterium]|nr:hypothetical protein [Candidatus Cloacimonadota bacterium]